MQKNHNFSYSARYSACYNTNLYEMMFSLLQYWHVVIVIVIVINSNTNSNSNQLFLSRIGGLSLGENLCLML